MIFGYAKEKADGHPILPRYTVSDIPAHTIVDLAVNVGASHLILGAPRRNMLVKLVRGNLILQVSRFLPRKFIYWFTRDWADWIRMYTFILLATAR
jgi:hypothetical protein